MFFLFLIRIYVRIYEGDELLKKLEKQRIYSPIYFPAYKNPREVFPSKDNIQIESPGSCENFERYVGRGILVLK